LAVWLFLSFCGSEASLDSAMTSITFDDLYWRLDHLPSGLPAAEKDHPLNLLFVRGARWDDADDEGEGAWQAFNTNMDAILQGAQRPDGRVGLKDGVLATGRYGLGGLRRYFEAWLEVIEADLILTKAQRISDGIDLYL
jgi:hypothetical protein